MTAGILMGVPERQDKKSCAPISRKISGSSARHKKYNQNSSAYHITPRNNVLFSLTYGNISL